MALVKVFRLPVPNGTLCGCPDGKRDPPQMPALAGGSQGARCQGKRAFFCTSEAGKTGRNHGIH